MEENIPYIVTLNHALSCLISYKIITTEYEKRLRKPIIMDCWV